MNKVEKMYFTLYDGEELDAFFDFLDANHIKYDCTGTGDVDYEGNAENNVIIFAENPFIVELVKKYLVSL